MSLSIRRILHPTDFSEESEQAFMMACGIARDNSAEIFVVYVVAADCRACDLNSGELDHDSELFDELWTKFMTLKTHSTNVSVKFEIKVGSPAECIATVAQEECCDLIVLAAHSHCYLHLQYRGSVSERLAKISGCPILCFRQTAFHQQPCRLLDGLRNELIVQPQH